MIRLVAVLLTTVFSLAFGWGSAAQAADGRAKATPVDFRGCNFHEGMGMEDLQKVATKFREYTNKNDFDYAAWTLHPEFQAKFEFDFGWLGSWSDSEAYGVSTEHWKLNGRAIYAEFAKVMDCTSTHQLAMSLPINAPKGTPEDGILMFYACNLEDGKSIDDAYAAHLNLGSDMKAMGSLAVSWFFQPALGGVAGVDYYHVVGFYRYADMGATMELYANGGGIASFRKNLGGVSSCNTPTVYDAVSVRARDER